MHVNRNFNVGGPKSITTSLLFSLLRAAASVCTGMLRSPYADYIYLLNFYSSLYSQHVIYLQPPSNSPINHDLEDKVENSATLCKEVTKLNTALQEYQDMVQVRYDN